MTEQMTNSAAVSAMPVQPSFGLLMPLSLSAVTITGGYWGDRQRINADATLPHCLSWIERLGWLANFERVAEGVAFEHEGREFSDSEIFKVLEALVWESARTGDAWAEQTYQRLSSIVVSAQQPDGYLNTRFGSPGQAARYTDLEWGHELYCAGHLIQAAVARLRTAGHDSLTEAALRLADHIVDTFGPDGRAAVCGHPEVEVALAELGRVTGDNRYLDQARLFVERRGHGLLAEQEVGSAYFQDDVPVAQADVLSGHAVRALYLSAGAVDVAIEGQDDELLAALRRQWRNTVARRTYLTGGMGSRHEGEAFGDDFELPSDRAYSETCAAVGSLMFSWRLLLASGGVEYADLMERTLYNVIAASPDEAGTSFFYVNPLQRDSVGSPAAEDRPSPRASSSLRAPWFEVSCCPNNIARTIASLSAYVATSDTSGIQLHQYMPSIIDTTLADGSRVAFTVETNYPDIGTIRVRIDAAPTTPWTLSLRIPSWASKATVLINGSSQQATAGVFKVRRTFAQDDEVVLRLPMKPRIVFPDSRIDSLRGCVAFERGPLVLCAESIDTLDGGGLERLAALPSTLFEEDELTTVHVVRDRADDLGFPYTTNVNDFAESIADTFALPLIAYNSWAERGPSTMRVWLPISTETSER
jgi:DUF1680 family protein